MTFVTNRRPLLIPATRHIRLGQDDGQRGGRAATDADAFDDAVPAGLALFWPAGQLGGDWHRPGDIAEVARLGLLRPMDIGPDSARHRLDGQ